MAKGPIVTPELAAIIARTHRQHPDWKAPKVRYEVEKAWRKKHPGSPVGFPSLSSVQRMLATIRKNEKLGSLEDRPWTLDTLGKDSLPPEALPKVFRIWLQMQASSNSPPLTIREAKWIAQFSRMTEDLRFVGHAASVCAVLVLIGELSDTPHLSWASTTFLIYSLATVMPQETFDELSPLIYREKHAVASQREQAIEIVKAIYGDEFIKDLKSKSKKGKGGK